MENIRRRDGAGWLRENTAASQRVTRDGKGAVKINHESHSVWNRYCSDVQT